MAKVEIFDKQPEFGYILIMLFRELLKKEIERRGWKTSQMAAEKMNFDAEYLRQILSGKRGCPSDDKIVHIAGALWPETDPERDKKILLYLTTAAQERAENEETKKIWSSLSREQSAEAIAAGMLGEPSNQAHLPPDVHKIQVYSTICAGSGNLGQYDGEVIDEIFVCEEYKRMGVFAIRIEGDSMIPELYPDEYALFKPVNGNIPREKDICALEIADWGFWTVKFVRLDSSSGMVHLISANPAFQVRELDRDSVKVKGILIEGRRIRRKRYSIEERPGKYGK